MKRSEFKTKALAILDSIREPADLAPAVLSQKNHPGCIVQRVLEQTDVAGCIKLAARLNDGWTRKEVENLTNINDDFVGGKVSIDRLRSYIEEICVEKGE